MKKRYKLAIAAAAIGMGSVAVGTLPAQAAFDGGYAPNYFTLYTGGYGYADTTNAPNQITLYGSQTNTGVTDYTATSLANGVVSYQWDYYTVDNRASNNPFNFVLNNVSTPIYRDTGSDNGTGTESVAVNTGDKFGFEIATTNNTSFGGSVKISNFSAPSSPVPEPMSILGSLTAITFGANLCRTFKQQKRAKAKV